MHEKTAFRSASPPPRTHPGQRTALGGGGRGPRSREFRCRFPPSANRRKQKTSRALEPFRPVLRKQGFRRDNPENQRFPRSRIRTAGSPDPLPLSFKPPPAGAVGMVFRSARPANPHQGERPIRERPASRSMRLLPAPSEGNNGKKPNKLPFRTPTLGAADGKPPALPRGNSFFRQTAKSRRIYWLNVKNSLQ
jgi:hypothetical protein